MTSNIEAEFIDYVIRGACTEIDSAVLAKAIVENRDGDLNLSMVEPHHLRDAIGQCETPRSWFASLLIQARHSDCLGCAEFEAEPLSDNGLTNEAPVQSASDQ